MSSILADRVKETTTTTGTGTVDLGGAAAANYQKFVDGIGNGNNARFVVFESGNGTDWEIDQDCLVTAGSPDTLTRGTLVISSTGSRISLSGTSTVFVDAPAVLLMLLASIADQTVLGNVSGSIGLASALSKAQLTALINAFSSSLSGAVPASGGGTTNYLRADGSWASPPGTGGATGAIPTATASDTAVTGSASTYMRSDAAPAVQKASASQFGLIKLDGASLGASGGVGSVKAYGPLYPVSAFPGDTSGRLWPQFMPITSNLRHRTMGVKASLDADAAWRVMFQMPPFIPSGTCKLLLRASATGATSGTAKVTPKWLLVGDGYDIGNVVLNAEAQQTYTWSNTGLQNVTAAAVSAGGSGYVVGDVLTISGGTATTAAKLKVATLSGSAVATVTIIEPGVYTSTPSNPASVTGGSGSSATFTLTYDSAGSSDKLTTTKVTLGANAVPTAGVDENKLMLMDLVFNTSGWTLASISGWTASLIWE